MQLKICGKIVYLKDYHVKGGSPTSSRNYAIRCYGGHVLVNGYRHVRHELTMQLHV